tara:strand:+ start:103194 stop:105323 length:2130 start_codon:yes stop_codon:yes gene_type:complete
MVAHEDEIQMNKQSILLNKKRLLLLPSGLGTRRQAFDQRGMVLQAEVMSLGFILSPEAMEQLTTLTEARFNTVFRQTLTNLKEVVGADVTYTPMYPDFPRQVMEMGAMRLYGNALMHYWSGGAWQPDYHQGNTDAPQFENSKFREIGLGKEEDVLLTLSQILASNASITDYDKKVLTYLFNNYEEHQLTQALPPAIPFKETMAFFVGECLDSNRPSLGMAALKTATDVLRVCTHLSGGDVSLATNTKFKSFSRKIRKAVVYRLNVIARDDDIFRHRGKWIRLAHSLHTGEYAYAKHLNAIVSRLRSKDYKHLSYEANVETFINSGSYFGASVLLKKRPGVFARKLDNLLRKSDVKTGKDILENFASVADDIDTRVLMQLFGHFRTRATGPSERLVFPKGSAAKAILLKTKLPTLKPSIVDKVMDTIQASLQNRFSKLESLGKVFLSNDLEGCPIPLSLRSASESLETVARGTRFTLTDKNTLRLFIYWKGRDIDLSASFLDAEFVHKSDVAYTNLRDGTISCHSGDIMNAPHGAAEFIDIDMTKALKAGYRYVAMQVYVYSGPSFKDHEICYAGWMTRDCPDSSDKFNAKYVDQKVNLTQDSSRAVPVIFDMQERQAIWMDLEGSTDTFRNSNSRVPNNTITNRATTLDIVRGSVNLDNKPTLYDLFVMHANVRGTEYVEDPLEADTIFSMTEGIKPSDTTEILSEYLA